MYRELLSEIKLKNQKLLILGAGISGFAVAELCARAGISAELWDQAAREKFADHLVSGVDFKFAEDNKVVDPVFALVVASPGIPPKSELFKICRDHSLPVISELELGLSLIRESSNCKQIVVTGSNGKSTTVSLIQHILTNCNKKSALVGNIGKSPLDLLAADFNLKDPLDCLVVEASSYQLELFNYYRPDIALILNLSENHLERHGNMAAYMLAKARLIQNCVNQDYVVVPEDADWAEDLIASCKADFLRFKLDYKYTSSNLLGEHNLKNIAAAVLACEQVGIDSSAALASAQSFKSLEHRLEKLDLSGDLLIFNDSKATTVEASVAACKAVLSANFNRNIILMLGGQEKKNSDWRQINQLVLENHNKFSKLLLFGFSAKSIAENLPDIQNKVEIFSGLAQALEDIKIKLSVEDILLFAPGCASFDEFKNFEVRGAFFKNSFS